MEWISVKDKLPEKGQVLAWCKEENYLKKDYYYEGVALLYYTKNKKFVDPFDFSDDYTKIVTHWMIPTKPQ